MFVIAVSGAVGGVKDELKEAQDSIETEKDSDRNSSN